MNAVTVPELTIDAFEAGSVDADAFDHEAHIYVAWLYLQRYAPHEAIGRFTDALKRLTRQLGIPGKYHDTISWFFLLLIEERRDGSGDWFAFRRNNNDLFARDSNILSRDYSRDLLTSDRARQSFVLPDLIAT